MRIVFSPNERTAEANKRTRSRVVNEWMQTNVCEKRDALKEKEVQKTIKVTNA